MDNSFRKYLEELREDCLRRIAQGGTRDEMESWFARVDHYNRLLDRKEAA